MEIVRKRNLENPMIVMEVKGYPQHFYEGEFFRIQNDKYSKDALSIVKPCDTVIECDTRILLRYWHKGKWVYVANTMRR